MNTCDNCANKDSEYCESENRDKYGFCGNFCGDLISRSALKEKLKNRYEFEQDEMDKGWNLGIGVAVNLTETAPTVAPTVEAFTSEQVKELKEVMEKKIALASGYWIAKDDSWICSECKEENAYAYDRNIDKFTDNFCPNCGADMRGDAE